MKVQIHAVAIVTIILVFALVSFSASAHTTSQVGILEQTYVEELEYNCIGGEEIGWIVNEHEHIGSASFQYRFIDIEDSSYYYVAEQYKPIFLDAVAMWSDVATMTESDTATGLVHCYDSEEDGLSAIIFCHCPDATTGHLEAWDLYINREDLPTAKKVAHELGHIMGLVDLYSVENQNKLMYYNADFTATSPTESDLWGAKVILGIHVNHEFSKYRYWGVDRYGNPQHNAYCTFCNGNSVVISACVIAGPNGECLYCDA